MEQRKYLDFEIKNQLEFISGLMNFGSKYKNFCVLNSNQYEHDKYSRFDFLAGVGIKFEISSNQEKSGFKRLSEFTDEYNDWIFGYLSYDLKNELETLFSKNPDFIEFQEIHFFVPELVFLNTNNVLKIGYFSSQHTENDIKQIANRLIEWKNETSQPLTKFQIKSRISKQEYLQKIIEIKQQIKFGNIYEMNFCQEFYAENADINPGELYEKLIKTSPNPFSCYYKIDKNYLISASPERFMQNNYSTIISQPIKGTIERGNDEKDDKSKKEELYLSRKDRSENVMIVDLVRNDLSKTAKKGSVKVEELFGIYSFKNVHQMISTVSSEKKDEVHITDVIKYAFPMGSMTGTPKIRAMQLIDDFESTKRGLFSGAVGYFNPEKGFDFNVVIRSFQYNEKKHYLSIMVGGAITYLSDPEQEYNECMVKAKPLLDLLTSKK